MRCWIQHRSLLKEALEFPSIEVLHEQAEQFDKTAGVLNYSVPASEVIERRMDRTMFRK